MTYKELIERFATEHGYDFKKEGRIITLKKEYVGSEYDYIQTIDFDIMKYDGLDTLMITPYIDGIGFVENSQQIKDITIALNRLKQDCSEFNKLHHRILENEK